MRAATGALAQAERARLAAEARIPEVKAVVADLRRERADNHFAERIKEIYKGVPHARPEH
ncbi:DUF7620 family protein [Streptomyces cinereoruber]|uniref:DUF7620 family protein n=1 Tax=Streptomyces cinereoruber TaxID=67260 RepID=UPI003633CDB3